VALRNPDSTQFQIRKKLRKTRVLKKLKADFNHRPPDEFILCDQIEDVHFGRLWPVE